MNLYFDIDETICKVVGEDKTDYNKAQPILCRIQKVNKLYDEGHKITYWTARGTISGIDWKEITDAQLKSWGCKYHKLILGKPAFDYFIDDKVINSEKFFNEDVKLIGDK